MKSSIRTLILFLPLVAAGPRTAYAQAEAGSSQLAPDEERRRTLFQEGKDAVKARKWDVAHTKLAVAWELRRSFDVALVLSQAEFKLGRFAESAEHLSYYLRSVSAKEKEENIANAREALAAAKTHVATLQISAPKGGEVLVDGRVVGTAPIEDVVFVIPGKRTFEARLGDEQISLERDLGAGTEQTVALVFPARPAASPGPASGLPTLRADVQSETRRPEEAPSYTASALAATVGGGAVASGIVMLVVANGKDADREKLVAQLPDNGCGQSPAPSDCTRVADLSDRAAAYRVVAYASLGVGLAAGIASYLLWPKNGASTARRVILTPTVSGGPSVFTVGASGRF